MNPSPLTIDRGGRGSPSFNRAKDEAIGRMTLAEMLVGGKVTVISPRNDEDLPEGRPV